MAAYVLVQVEVTDPEAYREYAQGAAPIVERYGGRFLARGGRYETLEGDWQPKRVVIIEFPSFEQAKAWHDSPEYREVRPIRERNAKTQFLTVVEGVY